ncbi:hypothetical protein A3K73_04325 [Candidatus Pacearchaeota archaeon RBG_13_36_9]|nr:MAG: hypothetical protein A3K73_04325 [Candidatus Pacearchaeota archaeon RBG_13_36_9]
MVKITENRRRIAVLLGDPNMPDPVKRGGMFNPEDINVVNRLKKALNKLQGYEFVYFDDHKNLKGNLRDFNSSRGGYALNLCDEGFFNLPSKEKDIPLMLEELGIPYTGAGAECMTVCYDKSLVKELAEKEGIPVPKSYHLGKDSLELKLEFPVIVKPSCADGGFGITQKSIVNNNKELKSAISDLRKEFLYKGKIILEEFLQGNEISAGIIGNPPNCHEILPLIQEDYSSLPENLPKICGYESKWLPESPYWGCSKSAPANLPEQTRRIIEEDSLRLFQNVGCRDYARFDWRLDSSGNPKLLEINPNPGWCWDGHLAKMAGIGGISYPQMLEKILHAAEKRIFNSVLQ